MVRVCPCCSCRHLFGTIASVRRQVKISTCPTSLGTCTCGQVLATSERRSKFWLPSRSAFVKVGAGLTIAMTDPTNVFAMDDIKFMTGFNVEPVVASESAIGDAITRFYGSTSTNQEEISNLMKDLVDEENELELAAEESEMDLASLEKAAEEAPIIKLVNLILTDSVKRGASDIHIEPYE